MFSVGILIHVIFLFSIFDIYFKSPIVHDVTPYSPLHDSLADRLVLIVVDGLRAESLVNHTTMRYLRSIGNSNGRWGISNTRVPTESRPGHVAIIGGFYEDPSAVAKGWKENPVDFDSIFNQSQYTWCWGAYDIIDIFTKGNIHNQIYADKFDPYDQSFSTNKNTTLLDNWVFERVKSLLVESNSNSDLYKKLHSNKIIFFLHLLGTDTSGHTHKPKTQHFLTTIKFVDENIEEIERHFKNYYNDDGRTTFLVTSDHGMTDWGSHGMGGYHETQTPYILWGAGVQKVTNINQDYDPESVAMSISHRQDLSQADLTPLIATFLSIPVPVNSIGQLIPNLLDTSLSNKAKAIYSNSRQLLSQYNQKRLNVEKNAIPWIYYPFKPFEGKKVHEIVQFTEKLLLEEQYDKLIQFSFEIMTLSLNGLDYYHNYYQRPLLFTITCSFIGWILFLLKSILQQTLQAEKLVDNKKIRNTKLQFFYKIVKTFLLIISVCLCIIIYVQNLPMQYYIYFLLPILLWWYVLIPFNIWIQTWNNMKRRKEIFILGIKIFFYIFGSILLGLSFSHRWVLSLPLMGMGIWPFLSSYKHLLTKSLSIIWAVGCVLLSAFSFMPIIGKEVFIELVIAAGIIGVIPLVLHFYLLHKSNTNKESQTEMAVSLLQIIILILSLYIIRTQSWNFAERKAISLGLQTICWILAALLPVLPTLYSRRLFNRLVGINCSLLTFYLLMSVSHEGLFMITLILNVNCWMIIEYKLLGLGSIKMNQITFGNDRDSEKDSLISIERSISNHDFRRAFFFILYIVLAYFGTGNIASLNSFEVRWVICFTTSYRPFIITTLILLKTLAPFLSVACSFRAIQNLTKAPTGYLNIIVLIYSNIMGLHLLYHVRNIGSWLEIGMSISQFVIVQVITLFIVLINQIAKGLSEFEISNVLIIFKRKKKYV